MSSSSLLILTSDVDSDFATALCEKTGSPQYSLGIPPVYEASVTEADLPLVVEEVVIDYGDKEERTLDSSDVKESDIADAEKSAADAKALAEVAID